MWRTLPSATYSIRSRKSGQQTITTYPKAAFSPQSLFDSKGFLSAGPRVSLNFGFGPLPRPQALYVPRFAWVRLARTPAASVSVRQKSTYWNSPARPRTPHSNASSLQPNSAGAIIVLMYSISRCRAPGYVNDFVILSSFLRRHSFQVVVLRALGPALLDHRQSRKSEVRLARSNDGGGMQGCRNGIIWRNVQESIVHDRASLTYCLNHRTRCSH